MLRVVLAAAVAEADVEHPVGTGDDLAALVVRVRLRDDEELAPARRHDGLAAHPVLVDVRVVVRVGVVDVELRSVGRERDAEESFLVAVREGADREDRRGGEVAGRVDDAYSTGLLGDEHVRVVRAPRERDRAVEARHDGRELHAHARGRAWPARSSSSKSTSRSRRDEVLVVGAGLVGGIGVVG